MCHRQSRRGVSRQDIKKCKTIVCIADTLLHTYTFTRRRFYTQTLLHTETFTHSSFYTDAFTYRRFYRQRLLLTETCTHRRFYIQTLLHRHVYTQTRLHTDAFTHRDFYTHRNFYTQTLLHTETFTHTDTFYTQTLLHTDAFTQRDFFTHTHTDAFTHRHFHTRREQGLHGTPSLPFKIIRPEEEPGHVYLISCVHVSMGWCGEVPFSCEPEKERKWSYSKPACINTSWGLCALCPLQPRWFAISPKRSINGRTWQAANVSGLMHDGETEGLKQRCVHQQVSDSSGWLMLMHFIFKFNCPPRLPRSILIWAPPQSWPYLQHRCERRKIFQPVSKILILEFTTQSLQRPQM